MSNRSVYHVLPDNASGKWRVAQEKAQRASEVLDMKEDAIRRAKDIAQRNMPSQVIVHKMDGTIQREYTYGNDPVRYEG